MPALSDPLPPPHAAFAKRLSQGRKESTRTRPDMVVNCVAYKQGERFAVINLDEISEILKDDETFVWLGLREPDRDLLVRIQQEFGLHELAVEDTLSAHQRPKLEEYGNSLFLVFHTARLHEDIVYFGETHVFVGSRFLVSVRHGPSSSYGKVRERCESMPEKLAKGPGFALYGVMDHVVDNYLPIVDGLRDQFQQLEADIFTHNLSRETLAQLYDLKRELLLLRGATEPLLAICNELTRFHSDIIPKEIRPYFRDIADHVKRIDHAIDGMREMLTMAMQVHMTFVTVRQNEVVKRLAGWGAILAIPTMIFSLYGMNFTHMPELNWPYAYPAVLTSVVIACIWLYVRLKRIGWL
jgi:magnesium transporter